MKKLLGFDIETSPLPTRGDGSIDNQYDPASLKIYCAGLAEFVGGAPVQMLPLRGADRVMTRFELEKVVDTICGYLDEGFVLVAHNGIGFDLRILYANTGDERLKTIARRFTVDQCYNSICANGYGVSLAAVATAYNLSGKTEGMHGGLVEEMWGRSAEDDEKVLEYVARDAAAGVEAVVAHEKAGVFRWISKKGFAMYNRVMRPTDTAEQAMAYPMPDTSWMTKPISRSEALAWTE